MRQDIIWQYGEKIDEKLVYDFEEEINLKLPQDYLETVINNDGGRLLIVKNGRKFSSYMDFRNDKKNLSLNNYSRTKFNQFSNECRKDGRYPDYKKMINFAQDAGGDSYLFDYREDINNPKVVYWVHDLPQGHKDSFTVIADSFTDLLDKFILDEDLEIEEYVAPERKYAKNNFTWDYEWEYDVERDILGYPIYTNFIFPYSDINIYEVFGKEQVNSIPEYRLQELLTKHYYELLLRNKPQDKSIEEYLKEMYFTDLAIKNLKDGKGIIDNLAWYFHQEEGRVFLMLEGVYYTNRYINGKNLWYKEGM